MMAVIQKTKMIQTNVRSKAYTKKEQRKKKIIWIVKTPSENLKPAVGHCHKMMMQKV